MPSAFTETLPCDLTDEERALKADQMAQQVKLHGEMQETKRVRTAELGKRIKDSDKLITELATMVRTGVEYREIACMERPNVHASTVEIVRMDDGTVVRTRSMEAAEKQQQLFDAGYNVLPFNRGKPDADKPEH